MNAVRGRKRHGTGRKVSKTISISEEVLARLESLGNGCLSAGVELVEHMTRTATPIASLAEIRERAKLLAAMKAPAGRTWIVFELVDGPPDPPPAEGVQVDAWREV